MYGREEKLKRRKFKKTMIATGIVAMLGTNAISFGAGHMMGANIQRTEVTSEINETKPIDTLIDAEVEKNNEEEIEVVETENLKSYLLDKYNSLGNNLTETDLGCIMATSPYLYKEDGIYHYDTVCFEKEKEENIKFLNTEGDKTIYIFTDNTNEQKPIAGICKIDDKVVNVTVDSYSRSDASPVIADTNKYVDFDENIEKYYEETKQYFQERLASKTK